MAFGLTLVFLPILAVSAISLWYLEENIRGARAWEATLQEIRARGEPVDFEAMVPAPVPDDMNLAMLPLFRLGRDPQDASRELAVGQTEALARIDVKNGDFVRLNWMQGKKSDGKEIGTYVATRWQAAFPEARKLPGTLTQLDMLCPAINDLRLAANARPFCRFPRDYTTLPPYSRSLGAVTSLIHLSRVTNLHAVAALQEGRPEVALGDILAILKIDEGLRQEPILVSGLVAVAIYFIQGSSIWTGLESHAWNEAQLARLQQELQRIDFLADGQLCLRGEAMNCSGTFDYLRDHRKPIKEITDTSSQDGTAPSALGLTWIYGRMTETLTPRGWFELAKAKGVSITYRDARESIDLAARRVYPEPSKRLEKEIDQPHTYDVAEVLLSIASAPLFQSSGQFAHAQARADQAVIACALERYRLAHGVYPDALGALQPYFPEGLPHDPMSGKAYRYGLREDGTFLLYSIGWDEQDGGGKSAFLPDKPEVLDRNHGDWVWPSGK